MRAKRLTILIPLTLILVSCDLFSVTPQPFPVWTPIPTRTPGIVTPTPLIIFLTPTATPLPSDTPQVTILTPVSPTISPTDTATPQVTETPTITPSSAPIQSAAVDILGCNTSFDITHGMYEVTNAYVTVRNTGTVDLPNACALLRAIDEDREHPDKQRCVDNLPAQYEVNLKLTVDSKYKVDTIIQVDVSSNETLLLRLDQQSCRDISLFGGAPSDVGVVRPSEE